MERRLPVLSGLYVILTLVLAAVSSCSSGDNIVGGGDPVEISGVIISIDTFLPAQGVVVYLLDNEDKYASEPTGADGVFSITLPADSQFLLVTDDADASTDNWFPLINFEYARPIVGGAMSDVQIHACPQKGASTAPSAGGSIAVFDNFLANSDDQDYGNLFGPTTSAGAAGILSLLFIQAPPSSFMTIFTDGMSVTMDETTSFGPIGYVDGTKVFNQMFAADTSLGPDILLPTTTTATGPFGWVASFGKADFSDKNINVTIADSDSTRALNFGGPYAIPVRPGTLTLALFGLVNGTATTAQAALCAIGFSQVGC